MQNIELFDDNTAAILARLYEAFPVPTTLDARQFSGHSEINDFGGIVDEYGNPSKRFEVARETIYWLSGAGYIQFKDRHVYGCLGATLTPFGLDLLKSRPASLQQTESRRR